MNTLYFLYTYGYIALLAATFFIGCLFLRKKYPLEYKLLVGLSGLTLLVESVAMVSFIHRTQRPWLYNYFSPVESCCIVYIFYRAASHPLIKRLYLILLAVMFLSMGVLFYLTLNPVKLDHVALLFCLFFNLMAACFSLVDLVLHKADIPLTRHPFFWMASGTLIFCCMYILIPPLLDAPTKVPFAYFFVDILVSNLFMYSGFISCFICFHRMNYMPSSDVQAVVVV